MKTRYHNGEAPKRGDIVKGLVDGKDIFGVVIHAGTDPDGFCAIDEPALIVPLDCRNSVAVNLNAFVPEQSWNWHKIDYTDKANFKWKEDSL